jgi:hypothetical protein
MFKPVTGEFETECPNTETSFVLSTLYANPLPTLVLPTMSQEPVHGNLSHAMRDNYAEHGVDQVRPPYCSDYQTKPDD